MEETEKVSKEKYDELYALYRKADTAKPKPADVEALRDFLLVNPEKAKYIGDMSLQAEVQLLHQAFSNSKGSEIATDEVMHNMRQAMGYKTAPAIEKPLIHHVCLCWLRLQFCELKYTEATGGSLTLAQGEYWEKRLSSNQRRYLKATETLARIRKLNITVQVNVAEKMVVTG